MLGSWFGLIVGVAVGTSLGTPEGVALCTVYYNSGNHSPKQNTYLLAELGPQLFLPKTSFF